MIIISAILVALLLVSGQALWKGAVVDLNRLEEGGGLEHLLRSPKIYIGMALYIVATLAYIYLLSKYKYFQVQSLVVGGSLVLTLLIAVIIFHEHVVAINVIGVALIVCGALLVISR